MARGNIYYITKDKDRDISFTESDYYDKLDALCLDYVKDQDEEESEAPIGWLRDMLSGLGAAVTEGAGDFAFSFSFGGVEKMQQEYFRPKLEELKKQAEALTLFSVIRSAPCLDQILDNDCGDLVTLAEDGRDTDITVDDFIRRIKPGTVYYVYNKVILMH